MESLQADELGSNNELAESFRAAVEARLSPEATFREREEAALAIANAITRSFLQADLQRIADELGERVLVDGEEYRRHTEGTVRYHSLCGPLEIKRWTYRKTGRIRRKGRSYRGQSQSLVALDLAAGLAERTTPALAYSIAQGYAQGPMRVFEKSMRAAHRRVPARATLERVASTLGGMAKQDVVTIETILRRSEKVPERAHAISIGLDRTSVALIEEQPAQMCRSKRRRTPYKRTPPDPFEVNWRMGYVGTVSFVDRAAEAIESRRYAATPEEGGDELVARMMADVNSALKQNPKLRISIVQDGAIELWGLLWTALRANGVKKWSECIDRYHLNERLGVALAMVVRCSEKRAKIYANWQRDLDSRQTAIDRIHDWLERRRKRVAGSNRKDFDGHLNYFACNGNRLRYARMKREGLPIGSGVTEGACKSLFAARVKRSGQRWYQDGLTAVLTLRSIEASDRLPHFWRHFSGRFRASVRPLV